MLYSRQSASIVGFVVFVALAFGSSPPPTTSPATTPPTTTDTKADKSTSAATKRSDADVLADIEEHLDTVRKLKGGSYGDRTTVLLRVALYQSLAKTLNEASERTNGTLAQKAAELKREVSRDQIAEFPKLRRAWASVTGKTLWEHDVEVRAIGPKATTVDFVAGAFAANRNIKEFHTNVHQVLKELRFKRAQYRWFKGADEYTYYKIDSPNDNEIVSGVKE